MKDIVKAEIGIRQLYARCVDAVWRQDVAAFGQCYDVSGEWKLAGRHYCGRDEVERGFDELLSVNERVQMIMSNPILDYREDGVITRTQVTELIKRKDGLGVTTMGVYYERIIDAGDRWLFAWRHFDLHYYGPPDLSGTFYTVPDYGPFPAMPSPDGGTTVR